MPRERARQEFGDRDGGTTSDRKGERQGTGDGNRGDQHRDDRGTGSRKRDDRDVRGSDRKDSRYNCVIVKGMPPYDQNV